jgi:uncharacterized membrane protein
MECVFIVPVLVLLLFLPVPPHRAEIGAFVVLNAGIVAACFVWFGLRSARRTAWWAAFSLAAGRLLNSVKAVALFWLTIRLILAGLARELEIAQLRPTR